MTRNKLIEIKNVSFSYENRIVLDHVSLDINQGEFWAFTGVNGSGKTTLAKLILGLLKPTSGSINFSCCDNKEHKDIGYVPQKFNIDKQFPATVRELLLLKTKKLRHIEDLELTPLLDKQFSDLSGGQQQRVLIGLAIQNEPKLLILDEPESNVDLPSQKKLYTMLKKLNASGITIIMISHDIAIIPKIASDILLLNKKVLCITKARNAEKVLFKEFHGDFHVHVH